MKKIFILMAVMTAAIFTGCVTDKQVGAPGIELNFNAGADGITRATIEDNTTILSKTLNVYSFYGDRTLWRTFALNYTGGKWGYGTPVFHPTSGTTYHFSTVPDQLAGSERLLNGNLLPFTYTVADVPQQVDLIGAKAETTLDKTTANLIYKHLLTKINFTVAAPKDSRLILKITNLRIENVNNNGTYNFQGWAVNSGSKATYVYPDVFSNVTGVDAIGNDNLMLMPQQLAKANNGNNPQNKRIVFEYTVWQNGDSQPLYGGTYIYNFNETWEPNESRRYVIDLKCEYEDYIREFNCITVKVEPWGTESQTHI